MRRPRRPRLMKVRQRVKGIRAVYGIKGSLTESDFYRICNDRSIEIVRDPLFRKFFQRWGSVVRGIAFPWPDGSRAIALACLWEPTFDVFTAAHELGHTMMGHRGGFAQVKDPKTDPLEQEADLFAELLTLEKPPPIGLDDEVDELLEDIRAENRTLEKLYPDDELPDCGS